MKIGFIGLGIMGKPMSKNLLKAGHELVVYDLVKENVDDLTAAGAKYVPSSAAVAESCGTIITMLPNSPHVKAAVCGRGGILEGAAPGTIIIDMSSIAPAASQEIAGECEAGNVHMLDAPVSGGEPKAIDGTLSIMVGGDKDIFDRVKDGILLKMGSSAVHCGGIGSGNTTKLANQIIVALNIAALAEALTLSRMAGVDSGVVYDAIKGGLAGSAVMSAKAPMMMEGSYPPGFKIDLHIKDLTNAMDTAQGLGIPLPLTSQALEMMQTLHDEGYGQEDHSALARYYGETTGVWIGKPPAKS